MTRGERDAGPEKAVFAFEGIDATLQLVPLAARRILDVWGRKLSLAGWLSLPLNDRQALVRAGAAERVFAGEPAALGEVLARAVPPSVAMAPSLDPAPREIPSDLNAGLGVARPLEESRWQLLRALDRYALVKYASKPEKLGVAYDEIVGSLRITHLTHAGHVHMVDVGAKSPSVRRAVASARLCTARAVLEAIAKGDLPKGDVLAVARVAGIMASKRTPELIPLCHSVQTTHASVDFEVDAARGELRIRATIEAVDRTGVEMEAMVAASVAALTIYDMVKSADRWATIESVRLEEKSGGKSGVLVRPSPAGAP